MHMHILLVVLALVNHILDGELGFLCFLCRTIGGMLAEVMNGSFLDGDDYHPSSNKGWLVISGVTYASVIISVN